MFCSSFLAMNDLQIAAALRASSPDAIAELFDAYGERLFRYCWSMLRNREMAQRRAARHAGRGAGVHRSADGFRIAWPVALLTRPHGMPSAPGRFRRRADEAPVRPSQRDADSRLIAWNAVMSMAADEFEALDLACRHDVDLAPVLGLSAEEAQALLVWARQSLEWALGAEILVSRGHACPDRAEVLAGWAGTMTPRCSSVCSSTRPLRGLRTQAAPQRFRRAGLRPAARACAPAAGPGGSARLLRRTPALRVPGVRGEPDGGPGRVGVPRRGRAPGCGARP